MQMDPDKIRKLQQMGLGPVWQRRGLNADESSSVSATAALAGNASFHAAADAASVMGMDWATLEENIRGCDRCGLCQGRVHAVPGVGDRKARWLFVGEGPGRQEDAQGEPFVGPAGKLLDNMLRALGLARGTTTYIANIVKCRPVGADGRDRPPTADEVAACMPYLVRQIDLIRPDVIVALGKTAAVSLLGLPADTSLASLREKIHHYAGLPLIVTYHPAYLLRQPADKAKSWRDLCLAMSLLNGR
jgi:uracil-DNA glycosylase family 4